MELSEQLELRRSWLDLQWVPRQQNEEADALTNERFAAFDATRRIQVDIKALPWIVLTEMLEAGHGMVKELEQLRAERKAERAAGRERKKARKKLAAEGLKATDPW